MKGIVTINAGVCGFTTTVTADSEEMFKATLKIETNCPNIAKMAEELTEINPFEEIGPKGEKSNIRKSFETHGKHGACPVPSGMVKALEVAAGLALPKDVSITVTKEG